MSVKLRLRRMGRKKHPVYAIVATDGRSPRDGRYIEDLGRYLVVEEPARIENLQVDRINYWLEQGAQPTDTVRNILSKEGVLLARALQQQGKTEEEISAAVAQHRSARAAKEAGKETTQQRRARVLEAERKKAAEAEKERQAKEAEARRQAEEQRRAEAEAKAAAAAAEAAPAEEAPAAAEETTDAAPENTEA